MIDLIPHNSRIRLPRGTRVLSPLSGLEINVGGRFARFVYYAKDFRLVVRMKLKPYPKDLFFLVGSGNTNVKPEVKHYSPLQERLF